VFELLGVGGIILQLLLEGGLTKDHIVQTAMNALIVAVPRPDHDPGREARGDDRPCSRRAIEDVIAPMKAVLGGARSLCELSAAAERKLGGVPSDRLARRTGDQPETPA
jgi:hypothetical protein